VLRRLDRLAQALGLEPATEVAGRGSAGPLFDPVLRRA